MGAAAMKPSEVCSVSKHTVALDWKSSMYSNIVCGFVSVSHLTSCLTLAFSVKAIVARMRKKTLNVWMITLHVSLAKLR